MDVLDDLNASFYALDLQRETRSHFPLRTAHFTDDLNVAAKVDSLGSISTREVVGHIALLVVFDCAENCSSRLVTYLASVSFKLLVSPVEV